MWGRVPPFVVMLVAALALMLPVRAAESHIVRVSDRRSPGNEAQPDFFHDLFRRLIADTTSEFGPMTIEPVRERFSQARLLAELKAGRIDVTWTGSNIAREREGHPIRIPIDMGLIGQRVPIIRAQDAAAFAQVHSIDDLRHFTACQGAQWPDYDVLAASNLPQVTNVYFDQLYAMLRAGRCDYFARGLAEVMDEYQTYGGPDLMVFDPLVIAYPMPVYFYVAAGRDDLYRRLEKGLRTMVANGELRRMLVNHPGTQRAFPLERFDNATIIRLPNPNLSPETPLSDPALWLHVGSPSGGHS